MSEESTSLIDRTLFNIKARRQRTLDGGINCIPTPIPKFHYDYPGVELGSYYLVSGSAKSSKSKLTNFLFLYAPLLYAWEHPELIKLKIFYCLLEETQENVTLKFMSYLLYKLSNHKIRVDIKTLKSVERERLVSPEVINLLESMEYQSILRFYEDHVVFIPDRNPTGIYNTLVRYAENNGTVHKKKVEGFEKPIFDYYEPNDPNEYVMCIIDHISLISNERGFDLRQSIDKLSEYMKIVRNHYSYIPVVVQQQNSDTLSLDAVKNNRVSPTQKGLRDSQTPGLDCDLMIGITNPFGFQLLKYPNSNTGYDINKLRDSARFVDIVLSRDGPSNATWPLYFDGAVGYYAPLPSSVNISELNKVYELIAKISQS